MDDSMGVRLGERVARLQRIVDGFAGRQRPPARELSGEPHTVAILHDQVRHTVRHDSQVDDPRHVLPAQTHCGLRLAKEPGMYGEAGRRLGQNHLECDLFAERKLGDAENNAHSVATSDAPDTVLSKEDRTGSECPFRSTRSHSA